MTMEQLIMNQTQWQPCTGRSKPPPPPPPQPRLTRGFSERTPTGIYSLRRPHGCEEIEREPDVARCTDQEKVLYGPHRLRGAAQQWWESYRLAHNNPNTITLQEFTREI
ncbi:hypothetical protein U9M48_006685 [Paspalum notatum var. saurae]|uniref:Retrotransposon gag domain-containing protein n=1 Tax=Paspalum notatum var. saurae TaxID=547442 RepID=A0AAQ3PZ74_PASNO